MNEMKRESKYFKSHSSLTRAIMNFMY